MALTEADLKTIPDNGIDGENPGKYEGLLQDLQGNILKGHGRDHSIHLFLQWKSEKIEGVKQWIQWFTQTYVTSAKQQANESLRYRQEGISGEVFGNFFLTRHSYELLGIQPNKIPYDVPFRNTMKKADPDLDDPPKEEWEKGFQQEIHALVLLADDDPNKLSKLVEEITPKLCEVAVILHQENGFILRNKAGNVVEHFGFVDGVSQPLFMKRDIEKAKIDDNNFSKWDSRASLDIILVKDPNGKTEDSYGSYLVYRKLEQNVKAFRQDQRQLADDLNINNDLAGALVVGRFADGTPVTESDLSKGEKPNNNFNYDQDIEATKCPFHAHIRKSNPRGDTGRLESSVEFKEDLIAEKRHRIARRSISYGENDVTKEPETGSGLLFLCFQSNVENQFDFIQKRWANEHRFIQVQVGLDPVIGQGNSNIPQQWPIKWGEKETKTFPFQLWVIMKGGEYFFAPSISFLENLV
ncbi:MAG: Dyp-type peroxidase [Crocosphaera sp.]|nr:Dyp-type peroxidase [Crocosphaera sp.]